MISFLFKGFILHLFRVNKKWNNFQLWVRIITKMLQQSMVRLTICMRLFPPCEVITRRSGLRLLTIWGLGGGGGDLAGTTFPKLLPLETVRRPGEALALVYPLAVGETEV